MGHFGDLAQAGNYRGVFATYMTCLAKMDVRRMPKPVLRSTDMTNAARRIRTAQENPHEKHILRLEFALCFSALRLGSRAALDLVCRRTPTRCRRFIRKTFSIDKPITSASLQACGESVSLDIKIDNYPIAAVGPYDQMLRIDVTEQLRTGKHRLTVQCTSVEGPAAFFLQLDLTFAGDSRRSIVTDKNWLSDKRPAQTFGRVDRRLLIRRRPWNRNWRDRQLRSVEASAW